MTIELRKFSSETSATYPHVQSVKRFTTKLFLRIFLNSVIYETFPIRNFLRIRYARSNSRRKLLREFVINVFHEISTVTQVEGTFLVNRLARDLKKMSRRECCVWGCSNRKGKCPEDIAGNRLCGCHLPRNEGCFSYPALPYSLSQSDSW